MSEITTIQIQKSLKRELDSLREYKRETYADVIKKLIERFKEQEESELELSEEALKAIKEAREDVRKGKVYSTEQIKETLGL
ncbi:MAG: hypothetical protein J7J87_03815 [Candidatus Diapherotrites archaeon]|nr:hypothetical protein [Candidatus Diapherotrites archaeon]